MAVSLCAYVYMHVCIFIHVHMYMCIYVYTKSRARAQLYQSEKGEDEIWGKCKIINGIIKNK